MSHYDDEIKVPDDFELNALETVESAHMCCRAAWLWPEDDEQRENAMMAASLCGVDYILYLEKIVNIIQGPMDMAIDRARREMAESFRVWADRLYLEKVTNEMNERNADASED